MVSSYVSEVLSKLKNDFPLKAGAFIDDLRLGAGAGLLCIRTSLDNVFDHLEENVIPKFMDKLENFISSILDLLDKMTFKIGNLEA